MAGFGSDSGAAWETEELFAENRDSLMRYLRHHLDDASLAEDVLQETFIRFFQARSQGEEITQPKAWLFRVGHNLAIDHGRKKKPDLLDDEAWIKLEGQMQGNSGAAVVEARTHVSQLPWHKLTPAELECLRLRSEGLKFREVAEVLGLTISTVASYVTRAINKLKETDEGKADRSSEASERRRVTPIR